MSTNWISLSQSAGTGNQQVTVAADANTSIEQRQLRLVIAAGDQTKYVFIQQAGAPIRIVRIYFNAASDVVVPYTGGTASYNQSRFMVMAEYNDGTTRQIGDVTITGNTKNITNINTGTSVTQVDTLTATATYSGSSATTILTASTTIDVMQQSAPETNRITYSGTTAMEPYSYDVWGVDGTVVNLIASGYSGGQGILVFDSPVTKLYGNASNIFRPTMLNLITIDLPSSITNISSDVFNYSTNLVAVNGLENCDHIYFNGDTGNQFRNCSSLTTISLPTNMSGQTGGLTKTMFSGCTSLVTINYAGTMAQWNALSKHSSWRQGSAIRYIECSDGTIDLDQVPNNTIRYYAPAQLTIADSAITPSITSHTYSNGVGIILSSGDIASINTSGFTNCSGVTSIVLPDSITTIGDYAFYWCKKVNMTLPDNLITIGNNAFNWCGLTGLIIPTGVTTIGDRAFEDCVKITSIELPNSVTTIGKYAFYYCTGLTGVRLSDSLTRISECAFLNCDSLTGITIPNGVTTIDAKAFAGCYNLTGITLPNSLTTIGNSGFSQCYRLTGITIPNGVTTIGDFTFNRCYGLTGITLPDSITTISDYAFLYCSGMTEITLPDSVTTIGKDAFNHCESLAEITIPSGVTTIGESVFTACFNLTGVTLPNSLTKLDSFAFSNCRGLTEITIPSSVTNIGGYAFSYCRSLATINYNDTKAQWNSISKGNSWNNSVPATVVHCIDGDVQL